MSRSALSTRLSTDSLSNLLLLCLRKSTNNFYCGSLVFLWVDRQRGLALWSVNKAYYWNNKHRNTIWKKEIGRAVTVSLDLGGKVGKIFPGVLCVRSSKLVRQRQRTRFVPKPTLKHCRHKRPSQSETAVTLQVTPLTFPRPGHKPTR